MRNSWIASTLARGSRSWIVIVHFSITVHPCSPVRLVLSALGVILTPDLSAEGRSKPVKPQKKRRYANQYPLNLAIVPM